MLKERLDRGGYLSYALDTDALDGILGKGKTWFGQLMGDAQMVAWLIQLDIWVEKYGVSFV